jgi:hypothetical protein
MKSPRHDASVVVILNQQRCQMGGALDAVALTGFGLTNRFGLGQ